MQEREGGSFATGLYAGAVDALGMVVPVFAFGVGFGAAGISVSLAPWIIVGMSALVFAGAAQYAVLDLWYAPIPVLSMILVALAVNARHIILGMTLRPKLEGVPNTTI